jgi:outer membrane immunogenic protein
VIQVGAGVRIVVSSVLAAAVSIGVAQAADVAPSAVIYQPMPRPTFFSWDGFYVGGFIGGAWHGAVNVGEGVSQTGLGCYNVTCAPYNYDLKSSFLGGGTIGFNWQAGSFVFGLEGELGFLDLKGSAVDPNSAPFASDTTNTAKIGPWYSLATMRFGFAWDRVLFYMKGGGAFLHLDTSAVDNCVTGACGAAVINATGGKTVATWTLGGGIEWAFARHWTVKAEYMYLGVDETVTACGVAGGAVAAAGSTFCWSHQFEGLHTGKVGFNFKF